MSAIRPRQTVHRGFVLAAGFVLDTALIGMATARRRVLSLGSNVRDVYQSDGRLVVTVFEPVRVDTSAAIGAPLVRYGTVLSTAPLSTSETRALEHHDAALLLTQGGEARLYAFRDLEREDLASWLDLSAFHVASDLVPLGEVSAAPRAVMLASIEETLGRTVGITAPTDEARRTMAALLRREQPSAARRVSGLFAMIGGVWGMIRARAAPKAATVSGSATGESLARPRASFWQTLARFFSNLVLSSRLAAFIGRQHARYLARVFEMFDSSNLDEALRHAIPLDSELTGALQKTAPLRPYGPRDTLAIRPDSVKATSELGLGARLYHELQARYRRAFEQLVARGEIDKAAFVLAELLKVNEEAIAFLEKHGRYRLAAEIAEARNLAPGIAVRLWFLAGDRARAIRLARERNAFADAVARLDASDKRASHALRLVWADQLATSGAYAAAVDAIWPVESARSLALEWLDRAIEVGGVAGARMLARKARVVPDAFASVRDHVLRLLDDEEAERSVLTALGQELTVAPTAHTRVLAKVAARRFIRDKRSNDEQRLARRLLETSGDAILRADFEGPSGPPELEAPPVMVRAAAATHASITPTHNSDGYLMSLLDGTPTSTAQLVGDVATCGFVLGVFDGNESGNGQRNVSREVTSTIASTLREQLGKIAPSPDQCGVSLLHAIGDANRPLLVVNAERPGLGGVYCSATIATFSENVLVVAQVGHTRAYVLRGSSLVRVTRDHSFQNMLVERGELRAEDAAGFPLEDVNVRALGNEGVVADLWQLRVSDADIVLLCSDGLHRTVTDEQVRRALLEESTPHAKANALVSLALAAGSTDNIAVVVAKLEGKGLDRASTAVTPTRLLAAASDGRASANDDRPTLPREIRRAAGDRGNFAIHDVAELPDGRLLVALGEIGVWLLARDGRVLTRFGEPATRIVLSDHGDRAILVAPRGEAVRLARLNVLERRVRYWCDARVSAFAPDFDGSSWIVARGDTVYAIDATADSWEHGFSVDNRGAKVSAIRRSERAAHVWFSEVFVESEIWAFDAPPLTLRGRKLLTTAERSELGALSANGALVGWYAGESGRIVRLFANGEWKDMPNAPTVLPHRPELTADFLAVPTLTDDAAEVHVCGIATGSKLAHVVLEGARDVGARFQDGHLLVFDDSGRILVVSPSNGAVIREHRLG